ncbi:kinase-like domain-containing protein [Aspergillus pseudonomiae]|uniref:non-specific serine/threonine protein kinase n=1 Tax=Aspergillus pseudonomiae TaxID=1506151 RepID=A0A5N6HGD8_9EURO|nr:kinase-like domain-containing protein [Aspergillus pseudonomiae]KAB8253526.1 kinase-like domain-containing protein [Aspergillus pseudonomiae]KAE8404038.1 kinase-like domain-containing protein [Aspergillus pseudonomiae]
MGYSVCTSEKHELGQFSACRNLSLELLVRFVLYDPARFYPADIGCVLNSRYQIVTKVGYGTSSTIWLAQDMNQTHLALIVEPLREPLWIHRYRYIGDVIPSSILKVIVQMILQALDYLRSECHIIDTDLKPDNITVKIEDLPILDESAKDEHQNPLPQKVCSDGRTIYRTTGIITITNVDLSVYGDRPNSGRIQAEIYRAPELWDLLQGKKLFKDVDPVHAQEYNEPGHLSHITALLGPPPKDFWAMEKELNFSIRSLKDPILFPTNFNFQSLLKHIYGDDKTMFIEFVKRMIKRRPEERSSAKELLQGPWLAAEYDES